jgi:Uma2 family endonuclease
MPTTSEPAVEDPLENEATLHLFTVEEYMALDIPGRTELLGGLIYDVSPMFEPHAHAVEVLNDELTSGLHGGPYRVRPQCPLAVQGWSGKWAPEVDLAVVKKANYTQTPAAADTLAFIEVSDSTYADDLKKKIPIYVGSGVPTWQVNVPKRRVEFYPTPLRLGNPQIFVEGDAFEILGIPIAVADLFLPQPGGQTAPDSPVGPDSPAAD